MPTIQRKLLSTPTSPYVRKVRVCAALQNITLVCENAPPFENNAEQLTRAPMARVPALITPEYTFHDSGAICQHLGMVAETSADLELLSLGDALMDAAVAARLESLRPSLGFGGGDGAWIARQRSRIDRLVEVLETKAPRPDATWTLGSVTLAVALAYLDFRHPTIPWREHENLDAFANAHLERQVMRDTRFPS